MWNDRKLTSDLVFRPTVLVIDDERSYTEVMRDVLSQGGYEVITANGAAQALQQLSTVTPDLILLDIRMPDTDGLALLRQLRSDRSRAHFPILIVSGAMLTQEDREEYFRSGANGFLNKPFNSQVLKDTLSEFVLVEAST